jgi:methionyl-tRNA synthetase
MEEKSQDPQFISFEDFQKVDIRAGKITAAEPVPKSEKLLKLTVDFGEIGFRQVVAGIAKSYSPERLVGNTAAFVVNLAPRKIMGLESHGMILAAENVPETPGVSIALLSTLSVVGARVG